MISSLWVVFVFSMAISPCCHRLWLSVKSVLVRVETSVQSWASGASFSLLCPYTLHFSVLHFWTQRLYFFVSWLQMNVLPSLAQEGSRQAELMTSVPFVPSLKGTEDRPHCLAKRFVPSSNLDLYYVNGGVSRSFFIWTLLVKLTYKSNRSRTHIWVHSAGVA